MEVFPVTYHEDDELQHHLTLRCTDGTIMDFDFGRFTLSERMVVFNWMKNKVNA